MNIAFAVRNSTSPFDQVYLRQILETCNILRDAGHKVFAFILDHHESSVESIFPEGVELIYVAKPGDSKLPFYYDQNLADSDALANRVLTFLETQPLDVIEIPLWTGLGLSLVRCKRLLNLCADTKLVINAFCASITVDGEETVSLSSLIQREMETYCVRYADIVSSPFESVCEKLKSLCGRADFRYYDSQGIVKHLIELPAQGTPAWSAFRASVEGYRANFLPVSPMEIYLSEPKKRYRRVLQPVTVSLLLPFESQVTFEAMLASLPAMPERVTCQQIVYCISADPEVRQAFEALKLEAAVKLDLSESAAALPLAPVLEMCQGTYVVFVKPGVHLTEAYLSQAVAALERNSEIAAMGAYASGSLLHYPIGPVTGMTTLINTASPWSNLFRVSKLQQLAEASTALKWQFDDWALLLALVEKYQLIDMLPFTGLQHKLSPEVYARVFDRARVAEMLTDFPRSWSGSAGKLVKLLVLHPELFTVPDSSDLNTAGSPVIEISFPIEAPLPLAKHGISVSGYEGAGFEDRARVLPAETEVQLESEIGSESEPKHPSDSEISATAMTFSESEMETESSSEAQDSTFEVNFGSEMDSDEVVDHEDTSMGNHEAGIVSDVEASDFESVSEEPDTMTPLPLVADESALRVPDQEKSEPEDMNPEIGAITLNISHLFDDDEEEESLDPWMVAVAPEDSLIGDTDVEEPLKISIEDSEEDTPNEWTEFPETSAITKLGEESDETTLDGVVDGDSETIAPLTLARSVVEETPLQEEKGEEAVEENDDPLDWFQIFWTDGESFAEENSVAESYFAHDTHALEIRIESDAPISMIRIDPCNRKGKLALRRIEIWNNLTHMPMFTSSEENAFDNIMPCGDFEVEGIEHDSLVLEAVGDDPQIILDLEKTDGANIIISVEFTFMRDL